MENDSLASNNPNRYPGPAYRIQTRRLVIRCWNPADAPLVTAPFEVSVSHLAEWVPWSQMDADDLQVRIERLRRFRSEFDQGRQLMYGIFNCSETQVLGNAGLLMGVGAEARIALCWVYKDFVNQGIATEVVSALVKVAFEVGGIQRLEMHSDPDNHRSTAVPGKLAFIHEATLRKVDKTTTGAMRDTMIWTLIADDYPYTPSAQAQVSAYDVMGRQIL